MIARKALHGALQQLVHALPVVFGHGLAHRRQFTGGGQFIGTARHQFVGGQLALFVGR